MSRLLLVTHRSIDQDGGPAARWRAFARYLPELGWELDVISATEHLGASEFKLGASRTVRARATATSQLARIGAPAFRLAGVRPDALPLSMLWVARGALQVRRRIEWLKPDVVLATGPPIAGPFAARLGLRGEPPLIVELRDLWAGNPAFDAGGRALPRAEAWLLARARTIVACTPEAVADLRMRHPDLERRIVEVSNGFDPQVRSLVEPRVASERTEGERARQALTILHSGTLTPARPIAPLVHALADPRVAGHFRLVLHGHLSPSSRAEVERARQQGIVEIEVISPSPWEQALARIARADACLITQGRAAGDQTAIASKVYEYLALARPVLCLSDGGASEALLRRLKADQLCARLDVPETIVAALLRLRDHPPRPVSADLLARYNRRTLAAHMAELLEQARDGR